MHLLGETTQAPYDDVLRRGRIPLPPPLLRTPRQISPELVLVDRDLVPTERSVPARPSPAAAFEGETRDAIRRICELSDVNPPRTSRRRLLTYGVPATLWVEALVLIAAHPLGAT